MKQWSRERGGQELPGAAPPAPSRRGGGPDRAPDVLAGQADTHGGEAGTQRAARATPPDEGGRRSPPEIAGKGCRPRMRAGGAGPGPGPAAEGALRSGATGWTSNGWALTSADGRRVVASPPGRAGSQVDRFANCRRFRSPPSGRRAATTWVDSQRPSGANPRRQQPPSGPLVPARHRRGRVSRAQRQLRPGSVHFVCVRPPAQHARERAQPEDPTRSHQVCTIRGRLRRWPRPSKRTPAPAWPAAAAARPQRTDRNRSRAARGRRPPHVAVAPLTRVSDFLASRQFALTRSCAGTVTVRSPGLPPSTIFRRALLLSTLVSFSRFSGLASTWM
ncbi:hypothetical protein SUDANB15_07064 [Streptomyces sp. enrichment culture]